MLRERLRSLGVAQDAVAAVWPKWWSDAAESSSSARVELYFTVARGLGIDARSLIEQEQQPRFIWRDTARFKHGTGEGALELAGITSFGRSVASLLLRAMTESPHTIVGRSAGELRQAVLRERAPWVDLMDLIALSWSASVPVVHLRVFPWPRKRMAAMTTGLGDKWAVLLAKDASFPPHLAFYLAHELGHIALGHVASGAQIVDFDASEGPIAEVEGEQADNEELEADAFALELLTGHPEPVVLPLDPARVSASELARTASVVGQQRRIDPGTVALVYGHSTGDWQAANGAIRRLYQRPLPVWRAINGVARRELDMACLSSDSADFLDAVLGTEAATKPR